MNNQRDHGGGLDHAIAEFGGTKEDWLDLSTGINPVPYPLPEIPSHYWTNLPDTDAQENLVNAARRFWNVPEDLDILPSSGVSQLICALPNLANAGSVVIPQPTYNEHEASFRNAGWAIGDTGRAQVLVHPNNPDGRLHDIELNDLRDFELSIIDESFCDVTPKQSKINLAQSDGVIILKGLGKFWGLAGLRLGFAISNPKTIARLREIIGPWAVSGPAQFIGAHALNDQGWADKTRDRLHSDAQRLDDLMQSVGISCIGGTTLFRLYDCSDAQQLQLNLARNMVWSRCFPYSKTWVRLGLPGTAAQWRQLEKALRDL